MLAYAHNSEEIMTLSRFNGEDLSQTEWDEMVAIKNAINYNISQVHPEKMELFTSLFVKSLEGKSDVQSSNI